MEATFKNILGDLKKKIYHPVYLLAGEEPYFIDLISDTIEETILTPEEKEFNLAVLYGRDLDIPTVLDYAKRYPMMSNYQVVIIKEAQSLQGIDKISAYIDNPVPSTLLVLCYKGKIDKRKSLYKSIQKKGIYLDSKKISINKTPEWINEYMQSLGYTITHKATMLITEFVGNDISKISNEVSKLTINIPPGTQITDQHVENNIGISKEYNIFELNNALAEKDIYKANKIAFQLASSKEGNPIFPAIPILFSFFTKVMIYQENASKSDPKELASIVGCQPFLLNQYKNTARLYSRDKLIRVIGYLREYDLRSKGVNDTGTDGGELLKELIFKILH